ncbi:MAG: UDP-glucose 4-epimerase GalE [SAR324 cluster bacterium]|nr:UDP-glucose 4-epimerase GalE [SAR324 cluster bacterium]
MSATQCRVLVVGGAGYIGSHVVKALLRAGFQVTVFDNLSSGLRQNLQPGASFIHGDLLIPPQIREACRNIDAVIHLAALKAAGESMVIPDKYAVHNISGTINLLNEVVAAGINKFIFSSTAAVYGDPQYVPIDEKHPTQPANFYGFTKLEIERILDWYGRLKNLNHVCLRYFNAAGYDVEGEINGLEQSPANLLPIVMEAIVGKREKVMVFGDDYETRDGSCIRDYIHVTDLASGHVRALEYLLKGQPSLIVNLGTSQGLTVFEMLKAAREMSGIDFTVEQAPRRPGDPPVVLATSQKALEVLGWSPVHSDVKTLIQTMLKAYGFSKR